MTFTDEAQGQWRAPMGAKVLKCLNLTFGTPEEHHPLSAYLTAQGLLSDLVGSTGDVPGISGPGGGRMFHGDPRHGHEWHLLYPISAFVW